MMQNRNVRSIQRVDFLPVYSRATQISWRIAMCESTNKRNIGGERVRTWRERGLEVEVDIYQFNRILLSDNSYLILETR